MKDKHSNEQKLKESLATRKNKSSRPLADLIKQINEMSKKAKPENSWQPEPPLAA